MPIDSRVLELLRRWEDQEERGQPLSPEELCADAPELLEEVKQRIQGLRAFNRVLDTPKNVEQPSREPGLDPDQPLPSIRGYEVLDILGHGGMGVVYKAKQIKADRIIALKMILHAGHASKAVLARFRTEAEALARLQHPHIVQIHEVSESNGLPFFSLEFCPGGSLDKKLAGTPLPAREAAALVE